MSERILSDIIMSTIVLKNKESISGYDDPGYRCYQISNISNNGISYIFSLSNENNLYLNNMPSSFTRSSSYLINQPSKGKFKAPNCGQTQARQGTKHLNIYISCIHTIKNKKKK